MIVYTVNSAAAISRIPYRFPSRLRSGTLIIRFPRFRSAEVLLFADFFGS